MACTRDGHTDRGSSGLYLIREGDRYGFIDKSGKVAIEPQFEMALDFSEGLAAVSDRAGMGDTSPQFEVANEAEDHALAALTTLGGHWGYVDTAGKLVINPQFDVAGRFSEGLAPVLLGGRWGYVDRKGAMAINPQFDFAGPFAEGLAKVRVRGLIGYVDPKGQLAIGPQFHDGGEFSEGLAPVQIHGNWGFIDREGKYAINPQFESALPFRDHLAAVYVAESGVSMHDGWGYVDRTSKLVIIPQFRDARSFAEGLAVVDTVVKTGRHWGFIDGVGKLVIYPQFDEARGFSQGLAAVRVGDRWGFVDKSGKLVIDPQFREVGRFDGDLCPVSLPYTDKAWAYIDHAGKFVWGGAARTAAAQGRTFADIHNVGKAVMFCLTDRSAADAAGEQLAIGDYHLVTAARVKEILVRCSIPQEIPTTDGWGHPYEYYLTTDLSQKKIMAIRSAGADGLFSPGTYAKGTFDPSHVDEDIVWADGYFVRYPNY